MGICTEGGALKTSRMIYTDAEELQWMEQAKLSGIWKETGKQSAGDRTTIKSRHIKKPKYII